MLSGFRVTALHAPKGPITPVLNTVVPAPCHRLRVDECMSISSICLCILHHVAKYAVGGLVRGGCDD